VKKFIISFKKGNKQKAVDIAIPEDTALASQYLKLKQKQAMQQEEMKRRVLEYDARDRKEDEEAKKRLAKDNEPTLGATPYLQTERGQKNPNYKQLSNSGSTLGGSSSNTGGYAGKKSYFVSGTPPPRHGLDSVDEMFGNPNQSPQIRQRPPPPPGPSSTGRGSPRGGRYYSGRKK